MLIGRVNRCNQLVALSICLTLAACSDDSSQTADSTPAASTPAMTSEVAPKADEPAFTSMQMQGVEPVTIEVDIDAAAQRLSKGVQFPTISNQDRNDFDTKAFSDYHQYLVEAYPNVHKTLKREVLGDPRPYSLLYSWEGKDPSLPPALFYAHMDVVPVPDDSRDQWKQEPFSGAIADGYIWGRGVLDDKNQIHGILEAAEMKIEEGWQPSKAWRTRTDFR